MTTNLEVEKREGRAEAVRNTGRVPGVVYGPKQEPISISIDRLTFERTLESAGESTIISLNGLEEEAIEVLIHDVSYNAARGGVEHVDFYAIERGKELTTNVALDFVGEAPAEKAGMTVNKALHEVEVTCKPSALPSHIDVDISVLVDENSQIHVSDLKVGEGVKIEDEQDAVVATVAAAREEEPEEVAEAEAVDMDSIEVEAKGKDAEEGSEEEK